ncbi:MAG: hypothetical protein R3271_03140 [Methylophaga sp.]|uniref:hypothetical protein n=1 Tax=Methylophaga sp. TaxID=2024840 RepID=UPI00299D2BDB|nr:hypothetical protein [Methylophaga sp.]MDX1749297.1 hypothetical protein [Methylophaga sp.]
MSTQLVKTIFFVTMVTSLSVMAEETNESKETENPVTHSNNISSEKSSRGTVKQGVIGAEADENKKLVPESSPSETKKDTDPNIRLDDEITEDIETPESN